MAIIGSDTNAAYIFKRNATGRWVQAQKLVKPSNLAL